MRYAAEQLGMSFETVEDAQTRLTRSVFEALKGNEEVIRAFHDLGVTIYDTEGNLKNVNDVFWEVIVALGKMEDPIRRDGIAMELMGRSARDLNPIIEAGREQFEKLEERARSLGIVLSQDQVNALNETNNKWKDFKATLGITGALIATEFKPILDKLIDTLIINMPVATEKVKDLLAAFEAMSPETKKMIGNLAMLAFVIGPVIKLLWWVLTPLSKLFFFFKAHPFVLAFAGTIWMVSDALKRAEKYGVGFKEVGVELQIMWQRLANVFQHVFDVISYNFKATVNNVAADINRWIGYVNVLIAAINKIPGINIPGLPQIPSFGELQAPVYTPFDADAFRRSEGAYGTNATAQDNMTPVSNIIQIWLDGEMIQEKVNNGLGNQFLFGGAR